MPGLQDRRTTLRLLGAAGLSAAIPLRIGGVQAQAFPSRPITIVVPFQPGATNDILARAVAQHIIEAGKANVVVENKPGASGIIGAQAVARAEPDGYTIMIAPSGVLAINRWLFSKLSYDPEKDFAPLTLAGTVPNALIVNPSLPVNSVQELIAYGKENRGKLNYASMGTGTTGHLCGEMFKRAAGIELVHVPYKGSAPALNDLLGGQVQMMFDNLPTALPHINGNRLRGLAVTSAARHPQAPQIPTMIESGLPEVEATAWFGFAAPAKVPDAERKLLADFIIAALKDAKVRAQLEKLGVTVVANQPAEFAAFIASESRKWQKVVQDAGIKMEE
ncbi:MAG TPA: tripartite tricarboxylate transporter substrate binding protein [Xanthobacteraceae bacterium]